MSKPDPRIVTAARLQHARNYPAAEAIYLQILQKEPQHPDARFLLGLLFHQTARHEAAFDQLRQAISLQPANTDFRKTLVETLIALKRSDEAIVEAKTLAELAPSNAAFQLGLGQLLHSQGRIAEAIDAFQTGLKIAPNHDIGWNDLGTCYILTARPQEALACFETAVRLRPDEPGPRNNIGAALMDMGRLDNAIAAFEETRRLHPTYADASNNLANCYSTIGEPIKAMAAYRQALTIRPAFSGAHSNLLMCSLYPPGSDEKAIYAEHLAWDSQHAQPLRKEILPHANDFTRNRKLRIGYVSPDFREHSVRYFIEPILASHDREQFEIFCYASGSRRDEVTDRLRSHAFAWHDVAGLNDAALADLIRSHRIDILIDLAGHTSDHRLLTFARKPAPVQVTYLGYPATTGLETMDYRLTDSIADPDASSQEIYREELIRLPGAFFVFGDDQSVPFAPDLPADANGFVTFGSFNNMAKISDEVLSAWASILAATPNSRLLMNTRAMGNPSTRQRVLQFFSARGISTSRLQLWPWMTLAQYMNLLRSVDITLDTFPFNGHTTSCKSLWMGAPFITLTGNHFRGRMGTTIVHHLDLQDLIATSQQDYVERAVNLPNDRPRLRELRRTMRERLLRSPLTDAAAFTAGLETIYRRMWERACDPS
jgi:protein O-GlcNAc transferase